MKIDSIKLRKFREKHRLSQAEFAESIGLSQSTVCEWERKDTVIKLDHYSKLKEVYGTDANQIAKNDTTINTNHIENDNNEINATISSELKFDAFQLQKDYMDTLKATNEFYQNSFTSLINNLSDLIKKIG